MGEKYVIKCSGSSIILSKWLPREVAENELDLLMSQISRYILVELLQRQTVFIEILEHDYRLHLQRYFS